LTYDGRYRVFLADNSAAQGTLYGIVRRYKKWAPFIIPPLTKALKIHDIDAVKGALHTLHMSTIEHALARNWEFTAVYIQSLMDAWNRFDRVVRYKTLLIYSILFKIMRFLILRRSEDTIKLSRGEKASRKLSLKTFVPKEISTKRPSFLYKLVARRN
jgi:hypothetical protein